MSLVSVYTKDGFLYATQRAAILSTLRCCAIIEHLHSDAGRQYMLRECLLKTRNKHVCCNHDACESAKGSVSDLVLGSDLRSSAKNFDSAYLEVMAPIRCYGPAVC